MSKVLALSQATDPKQGILDAVGDISQLEVSHNFILIAIYIEPEKTKGGILMPHKTIQESIYQGKVGLVLKHGPLAYVDDESNKFMGQKIAPGDWVVFRNSDGLDLDVNGVRCKFIEEAHIRAKVPAPGMVY